MKAQNVLVMVFDDQSKTIDAYHDFQDLAIRGDISVGSNIMLRKGDDGKIEAMKSSLVDGKKTWSGMFIGMLTGLFFGPLGYMISVLTGTAIGAGMDYSHAKFEVGFVEKVKDQLEAGKFAIMAHCDESDPAFVNNAMEKYNCEIFRTVYTDK